jgi:non-specific serine/threonine protein kinase/serine/threonine-protein kinase
MTPERWSRVKSLFQAALDLPPAEREPMLRRRCERDPELLSEVLTLLERHRTDSFLETPAAEVAAAAEEAPEAAGLRIGSYRVEREIGRGGMGAVYLAVRDDDEYRKEVAVKLVKRGMDADHVVRRFRNERQILAQLDHPGIAKLLDGGTTEDGRPYLVMELVHGEPITRYSESRGLGLGSRLELFRRVCGAVQYAHQNLVVHRDLKPSNILVTGEGHPKLLDFGIAKILDPTSGGDEATVTAMRMLTPEYGSPEQVRGRPITTASDVYSLGVLLYELLAGRRPYRLATHAPEEVARAVCEQEPDRPSTATGNRRLVGDLDTIVMKALQKEPGRRYGSVEQLSEDVRRYLVGLPVLARPDTVGYRAAKFVWRHRTGVAAAALATVSLLGGLGATLWQARVAEAERQRAEAERARAQKRFEDVRRLAGSFLFEFHDAIYGLEGALPAKQLVVKRGLEYLESLAAEAGSDPTLRIELARAYFKLAGVQGSPWVALTLGDSVGATKSLRRGLELLGPVDEERLDDTIERAKAREVAAILEPLGRLQTMTGDVPGGLESHRRLMAIQEALGRGRTLDDRARDGILQAYQTAGDTWWFAGDWARALALFEKAVVAARQCDKSALAPGVVDGELGCAAWRVGLMSQYGADITMERLGDSRGRESLLARAQEAHETGVQAKKALVAADPSNAFWRRLLAESHLNLALVYADRGQQAAARARFREALSLSATVGEPHAVARVHFDWLQSPARLGDGSPQLRDAEVGLRRLGEAPAADPQNDQVPYGVGLAHEILAEVHGRVRDTVAEERALRSALAAHERSLGMNATNPAYFLAHSRAATSLARRLVEDGRLDAAREVTQRARATLESRAQAGRGFPTVLAEVAWFLLTCEPRQLRDTGAALAYAEQAVAQREGDSPDALATLAVARFWNGDGAGAVEAALRVYSLLPTAAAGRDEATLRREIPVNLQRLRPRPSRRLYF